MSRINVADMPDIRGFERVTGTRACCWIHLPVRAPAFPRVPSRLPSLCHLLEVTIGARESGIVMGGGGRFGEAND